MNRSAATGHSGQLAGRRAPGRPGHDGGMKLAQPAATARDLFSARILAKRR
ncbi:hypothetical protein [Amycolatopsis plumensis]|uniref:hypothetical protein n=1 Tax=Amycolatopsis plumensis TaxID=236508 RepID=UPI003620ABA4